MFNDLKGKKINCLGDSITEGACLADPKNECFVSLLASKYGAIVRNYGIGGTRIAHQTVTHNGCTSYDRDFCMRVDEMDPDADYIVVFGGTNDFGHGDAPFGEMSDRTSATFCGALHELYTKLIEKYPLATIVIITPLHRTGDEDRRADSNKNLYDYIYAIRKAAEYYSLPVLDLFATSGIQPNIEINKTTYTADGLHPNALGHRLIADRLAHFIMNL